MYEYLLNITKSTERLVFVTAYFNHYKHIMFPYRLKGLLLELIPSRFCSLLHRNNKFVALLFERRTFDVVVKRAQIQAEGLL